MIAATEATHRGKNGAQGPQGCPIAVVDKARDCRLERPEFGRIRAPSVPCSFSVALDRAWSVIAPAFLIPVALFPPVVPLQRKNGRDPCGQVC